jgi:HK97 gp10 family phage protein
MTIQYRQGISRLTQIPAKVMAIVDQELEEAAEEIQFLAQDLAAVDTGEMRSKIHVERISHLALQVRADADHSAFVEYGTRYMAAQPFMTPAVEAVWPRTQRNIGDAINKGLS